MSKILNRVGRLHNNRMGIYERSGNYRSEFFKHNRPRFRKYFICVYCGKLCTAEKITVDHLVPVASVKQHKKLSKKVKAAVHRTLLRWCGIENVNDVRNLVPVCKMCNQKKGAKTGVWVLQGILGRYSIYWIVRIVVLTLIFIWIVRLFL